MALRWQGFGDPGLRRGPSPSVASLQGVVRMQPPPLLHTDRHTHTHTWRLRLWCRCAFPVQAGVLQGARGQHPKACQGEMETVPRECIFFRAGGAGG